MITSLKVAILIALALFAASYCILMLRSALHHRRARIARANVTLQGFFEEFAGTSYESKAIETAYNDIVNLYRSPVHRTDDLEKTLGILPEAFEDMLEERCHKIGMTLSEMLKSPYAHHLPVQTVEDYVRFLSEVMRREHPKIN